MSKYRKVEKNFPFFDGKPEEWQSFLYQFRQISTICKYYLEAQFAITGMMMSPQNLETVLENRDEIW